MPKNYNIYEGFIFLLFYFLFPLKGMELEKINPSSRLIHMIIPEYQWPSIDEQKKHITIFKKCLESNKIYFSQDDDSKSSCTDLWRHNIEMNYKTYIIREIFNDNKNELKNYNRMIEHAMKNPFDYLQNFTLSGYINQNESEYEFLSKTRENFKKRAIVYYGEARPDNTSDESMEFRKNTFGEEFQSNMLEKKNETELKNIPIYSLCMKSLDWKENLSEKKPEEDRYFGFIFASGINLESKTTSDFLTLQSSSNKTEMLKKLNEMILFRARLWINAGIEQAQYLKKTHKKEKHFIIIPKIGLGWFAKYAQDLKLSSNELIDGYYNSYMKIILELKSSLERNNIQIIFFNYPDDKDNRINSIIERYTDLKNICQIISKTINMYRTSWMQDIKNYCPKSSSIIYIHAGDNHAYFNNGGLSDVSMEQRSCTWREKTSIEDGAANLAPFLTNIRLIDLYHESNGYYSIVKKKFFMNILKEPTIFKTIKEIFNNSYYNKCYEALKEEYNNYTSLPFEELTIWTYNTPEEVRNHYAKKYPVYFGLPITELYKENNFKEFHKNIFQEEIKEIEGIEGIEEILTCEIENLGAKLHKNRIKIPEKIFFAHTYGINFETAHTPDYITFNAIASEQGREQAFIKKTARIFYLALKATFEEAQKKNKKIAIIWPRIGFGSFANHIHNLMNVSQELKEILNNITFKKKDIYKYLSILGYREALNTILNEYNNNIKEIEICFSTLNYSSLELDSGKQQCEELYKKLIIEDPNFKNNNNIKFIIGDENIFDPNSEKIKDFLIRNADSFCAFFHSGDPHSFVGNGGPTDPTLEGCMFGAHHVAAIEKPMILMPISKMNIIFYFFEMNFFNEYKNSFIKQVQRIPEIPEKINKEMHPEIEKIEDQGNISINNNNNNNINWKIFLWLAGGTVVLGGFIFIYNNIEKILEFLNINKRKFDILKK